MDSPISPGPQQQYDSTGGCLIRLFWMVVGNVALFLCALVIAQARGAWPVAADVVFWLTLVFIIVARYADIRYFQGKTGDGRRAGMADLRRHALVLIGVALVVWLAAHGVRVLSS